MIGAKSVATIAMLAFCFCAAADEVKHSKAETVNTETESGEQNQQVEVLKYSPTQIFCMKQQRPGSRVSQNKCQTLADWQREIDERNMRRSLIRARGKAASWETSP